jgi:hypothetical protein
MVERQARGRDEVHPGRLGGIIAAAGSTATTPELENDRDRVFSGVPMGIGVDAQKPRHFCGEARLFPKLPDDRLLDRLSELDEPSR